jgi:hypothetical protein
MMSLIARNAAAVLLLSCALPPPAHAAFIQGDAVFAVEYRGSGEDGDSFDPPLVGPGAFVIRSLPYRPDTPHEDPFPPPEFDVLDFTFSFNGQRWDESDVPICECLFTPDGLPLGISFHFDDGAVSWILSWNFEDGNFGFRYHDASFDLAGTSADGAVSGRIDRDFQVLSEPESLALFGLGLALVALARRRASARLLDGLDDCVESPPVRIRPVDRYRRLAYGPFRPESKFSSPSCRIPRLFPCRRTSFHRPSTTPGSSRSSSSCSAAGPTSIPSI